MTLSAWQKIPFEKQVLTIVIDLQRARKRLPIDLKEAQQSYLTALGLIQLSLASTKTLGREMEFSALRELLESLLARLPEIRAEENDAIIRALLEMTPESLEQMEFI